MRSVQSRPGPKPINLHTFALQKFELNTSGTYQNKKYKHCNFCLSDCNDLPLTEEKMMKIVISAGLKNRCLEMIINSLLQLGIEMLRFPHAF